LKVRRVRVLIASVALLAACSGPSGPPPAELQRLENPREVRLLWSANVGAGERFTFIPALVADAVYTAARDGTVTRLDAVKGTEAWRVEVELRLSGGAGADTRTVAVASEEGVVVALDADNGKERWRARVSSEVLAPPAVAGGMVLVRSIDNRVFAFGADDGKRRWVYQRAPTALLVRAPAGMAIISGLAIGGFPGGKLVALSMSNGAVRWEATVAAPKGTTELERVSDVIGEPALQGREVCAAAYRGRVACFDAASGRPLWGRDLSPLSAVTLDARYAFVADEKGAVHALDRTNGQSVWKQDKLAYRGLSAPQADGEAIAVGDFEGYVHFLARDSGAFLARRETDGGAVRATPLALREGLLVQTAGGGVYAFGAPEAAR